jgi:quercetin dioxygenase-like cupin family protein
MAAMSDYTHMNLDAVPDMAPQFDMPAGLEARFARAPLGCETSGMTLFRMAPNFRVPFGHRHAEQEEIYVLISGSAKLHVGDEVLELAPMDAVRVAPQPARAAQAGPDGAVVLAFGAGPEGDGEIVQDFWKD